MAIITKIAASTAAGVSHTQPVGEKVQRTDAGQDLEVRKSEITQPQGVKEVLKTQKNNELKRENLPQQNVEELSRQLQEALDKAAHDQYEVGFRQKSDDNSYVIEIKDEEGNLVKQFPPEKVLNLQRKMDELSGMVIDEMI